MKFITFSLAALASMAAVSAFPSPFPSEEVVNLYITFNDGKKNHVHYLRVGYPPKGTPRYLQHTTVTANCKLLGDVPGDFTYHRGTSGRGTLTESIASSEKGKGSLTLYGTLLTLSPNLVNSGLPSSKNEPMEFEFVRDKVINWKFVVWMNGLDPKNMSIHAYGDPWGLDRCPFPVCHDAELHMQRVG